MNTLLNRFYQWIDARAHIAPLVEHVKTKAVARTGTACGITSAGLRCS